MLAPAAWPLPAPQAGYPLRRRARRKGALSRRARSGDRTSSLLARAASPDRAFAESAVNPVCDGVQLLLPLLLGVNEEVHLALRCLREPLGGHADQADGLERPPVKQFP